MAISRLLKRTIVPGLGALWLMAGPGLAAAQDNKEGGAGSPPAIAEPGSSLSLTVADSPAGVKPQPAARAYRVKLSVDGNLAGRVSMLNFSGKLVPVMASVSFLQEGKVIATARSNEHGYFQVKGLSPGVYTVVSDAGAQFGAYSVTVLPYDANAPLEEMQLELQLTPLEKITTAGGAGPDVPAAAGGAAVDQPVMMGGGGGGGGGGEGIGALAGLAALAAAVAAGENNGGGGGIHFVSPFTP